MTVFQSVKPEDLAKLLNKGFTKEKPKTIYEIIRLKKNNVTVILYSSGKLLIQGPQEKKEEITNQIRKLHLGEEIKPLSFRREHGVIIGSDECLKGDTFGGVVVAAVKADKNIREQLLELGVADSKTLADAEILVMAEKIKSIAPCEIRSLLPEEYNQQGSITHILDKLHGESASYLKPGTHVVDKYPGCTVGDIIEEKAEAKYVEVAAASVIARATGLQQLEYLSTLAGFDLPKGSTHVREALVRLKNNNADFSKFVKMNFRNVKEVLGE